MLDNTKFDNLSVRKQKQTTAKIILTTEKSKLQNFKSDPVLQNATIL